MALSSADGEIILKQVPVGTWTFKVWHESIPYVKPIESEMMFTKGKFQVEIEPGENDLGTFKIAAPKQYTE